MGTSLGVDMKRGVTYGGHRHHLKVITIRRYGSIAKAAGVVVEWCVIRVSAMEFPSALRVRSG